MNRSRLDLDKALLDSSSAPDPALDALRQQDAAFLAAYPRSDALARATRPARRPRFAVAALGLAAAAAAVALVPGALTSPEVRAKGDDSVQLLLRRGAVAEPFTGAHVGANDTLVFRYSTTRAYMLVMRLGSDGARAWISEAGQSVRIEPGQDRTAPLGVRLDEDPEPERVLVLLSDDPLEVSVVRAALEAGLGRASPEARARLDPSPLDLPAYVASWWLEKRRP